MVSNSSYNQQERESLKDSLCEWKTVRSKRNTGEPRRKKTEGNKSQVSVQNSFSCLSSEVIVDSTCEESGLINRCVNNKRNRKQKILLKTDSHGRGLCSKIMEINTKLTISGMIKPGARANNVMEPCRLQGDEDFYVSIAGANDVSRNEANECLENIEKCLECNRKKSVVVATIPHRHNLLYYSCVNKEIRKTNMKLKILCANFPKCNILDLRTIERGMFTKYGMHLNGTGKMLLAKNISEMLDCKINVKSKLIL